MLVPCSTLHGEVRVSARSAGARPATMVMLTDRLPVFQRREGVLELRLDASNLIRDRHGPSLDLVIHLVLIGVVAAQHRGEW